jgi:hypothetical protein
LKKKENTLIDIDSFINLGKLKSQFNKREELQKELSEVKEDIDNFIDLFLNQYLFSLDKLDDIENIIAEKDLKKFIFLDQKFTVKKSPKLQINEILEDRGILDNLQYFSKNAGKSIEWEIIGGKMSDRITQKIIGPSIFMDIQNKKFYFIPANTDPQIKIDYENNTLSIIYPRGVSPGVNPYDFTYHVPTLIFGMKYLPYMGLEIDINTMEIKSSGV